MEFRRKVLLIVVLTVIVTAGALVGTMMYSLNKMDEAMSKGMEKPVIDNGKLLATNAANLAARMFDDYFSSIADYGHMADFAVQEAYKNGLKGDELRQYLLNRFKQIKDLNENVAFVYFGDENGNMYLWPDEPLPPDYDPRVRPWYIKAKENNGPSYTEPYRDAFTGKWVITYSEPVYVDGKFVGVVGIDVFVSTLMKEAMDIKLGKSGYIVLVNQEGLVLMHPKEEYINKLNIYKVPELQELAAELKKGKQEGTVIYTFEGIRRIAGYKRLSTTGWIVVATVPLQELTALLIEPLSNVISSSRTVFYKGIAMSAVLVALMLVFVYKSVNSLLNPLIKLRRAAQALAEGRLKEVSNIVRNIKYLEKDEIGALIEAFEAVSKDVVGTLHAISEKLERLAEGDLSNGLSVEAKGELRDVIDDLKTVSEKLKSTIGEIVNVATLLEEKANLVTQIAEDVSNAINQVTEAIQQVSIEAQRQQENINEITEGMRLVAEVSSESVRSMEEFEAAVGEVVNIAAEGGKKGEESIRQIESIQEMMNDIENAVRKVAEMSRSIEEITNVITNIAEQTNLLALNAAIEAARAGEAGRGFAVVAQEIRKLAEESKQAADNIKDIISKITEEIKSAVDATDKGVKVVSESSDTLRETISYLTNIADLLQDTSTRMSEVKTQILKTQEEIDKALKALENLAASAEETTASAEEVSSAMEEQTAAIDELHKAAGDLRDIVKSLRNIISRFKF
ncbi:methyl-accepting chemotaxis protein [Thermococcus barophilus]|uniref:Methyl-accepting chemotaxis protein n=1 Tax=Thermococcus barophilus TaxID=55802 RepID=A0A0S1XC29_THEBA|nr:methyl-accepting chemotaxis protein [Thermococcus barophilus]ALM75341.1 Methyl-accepting chemotaxis protein [Thermococcus barophilus]